MSIPPTYVDYTATAAQTDFAFSFEYLEDEHVTVAIDGVQQTLNTDFTIVTTPTKKVVLTSGATAGQIVRVRRQSQRDTDLVDFENGSVLTERELDRAYQHNRYLHQEIGELNDSSLQKAAGTTNWDAGNNKIVNVATPTDTSDASTKDYVDAKVSQVSTGATSPPNKYVFTGTAGANTTYSVTGAEVNGDTAYDVSIDGAVQEPTTDFTVDPDTDTLTIIPTLSGGEDIVVIERGFGVALTTGNIDSGNIANDAIVESKIADDSISLAKMKANSVDSDQYVDGSIDSVHLADGAVTAAKISTTDSKFNVQTNGNVGIGDTSPDKKVSVLLSSDLAYDASDVGNTTKGLRVTNTSTTNNVFSGMLISATGASNSASACIGVNVTGNKQGALVLATKRFAGSNFDVAETMRIDNDGNVFIADTANTPSTPTGGGILYVDSGALKYIGSSGTVTTLGPA